MILALWKLLHARSPSNERIWRGPLELEHESNFMFKVNYYVHFNWHFLLTLTLTGERSLPVLNRFDFDRRQLESHMVSKYKQICTFLVPGNFGPDENSTNDQNQRIFFHGENFAPKRTKNFAIFWPEKTGKKEDKDAKFSFNEVELHLWYLMYSLFAIKKNYWNTVGSF